MKPLLVALLLATTAWLATAPPARCAYCVASPCVSSGQCNSGCACVAPQGGLGTCMAVR